MLDAPVQAVVPDVGERVLRNAFREAPAGIALLRPDGSVVQANPELGRFFGSSPRRLRGSIFHDLLPPSQRAGFRAGLGRLVRGRADRHEAEALCHPARAPAFWAHLTASALRETAGQPPHLLVVVRDVTQRHTDDEARRRRTAGLVQVVRAQAEVASAGLSFDGVADLVLKGVQRLTGADGAVLIVMDGETEDDEPELRFHSASGSMRSLVGSRVTLTAGARKYLAGHLPLVIGAGLTGWPEVPGHCSNIVVPVSRRGRSLAVVWAASHRPAAFNAEDVASLGLLSGVISSALGNAVDSQDHQAVHQRLAMVARTCPVAIFGYDREGTVTFMDGAAVTPLADPTLLVGRSVFDLFSSLPDLAESARASLSGHKRLTLIHLAESGRHFEVSQGPVFGAEGEIAEVSGVAVDVTDRMEARRARRESDAKSRFLATMSHELRTPLNSVIGFAQLMASQDAGGLNHRQRRYVDNIQAGGQHLLALINDLLDIGRIQAGELHVSPQPVEVRTLVEEAVVGLNPQATERRQMLSVEGDTEVWAQTDARRLHQVLISLLANAMTVTPPGGQVCISCRRSAAGACLSVKDAGAGIAGDQLERIFDEFTQVGAEPAGRPSAGSGLGLALSRQLVVLMGGSIAVESGLGGGSTFSVCLPPALRRL